MRLIHLSRPAWFIGALCRGAGPRQWFPADKKGAADARELCAQCPVITDCLEHALADPTLEGIWGGTSEDQRDQIRRRRRRTA